MKTISILLAGMTLASSLHAQLVNDGATNTLANVTNTITGDVTVGTNGAFTLLILSDNALLTNSANGVISLNATARSNEVRLVSPSARWLMGNSLLVGSNGAMSRLVVSNGALVRDFFAHVGLNISSSNNVALVTGSGSVWSNNTLNVGYSGSGNRLTVSYGGVVQNDTTSLGFNDSPSSNNVAVVTDSGSALITANELVVGFRSAGNQLVVSNGAMALNNSGAVGRSIFGSNNLAVVTGSGSVWSNGMDLVVGRSAGSNELVVSNGALVSAGGSAFLGMDGSSRGNRLAVDGGTLLVASALTFGDGGARNRADVSNGGQLVSNDGSIGQNGSATSNTVVLTGLGSIWSNRAGLYIGNSGSNSRLVVSNGAAAYVGGKAVVGANSSSNSVTVADPGSNWKIASNFYVGSNGTFNLLVVSNGAAVLGGANANLGENASSIGNAAFVTGPNSYWSNFFNLNVGLFGGGNRLVVENGGMVASDAGRIGALSSGNEAVVTGAGSAWSIVNEFVVGDDGAANRLVVTNGGVVRDDEGSVGFGNPKGSNNVALVTGSGSLWSNAASLFIGRFGSGNLLVVSNGATVVASNVFVSSSSVAFNNRIVVDGGTLRASNAVTNGVLDVQRGTNVLNAGLIDVDRLLLTNTLSRFEFNGGTLITRGAALSNNAAFVIGESGLAPAVWDVRAGAGDHILAAHLYVGLNNSSFNQLFVTNGALLTNLFSFNVGSGSSNTATISGPGSRCGIGGGISVSGGDFNRLAVSNGATLISRGDSYIGALFSGTNNHVQITGPGSVWQQFGPVQFAGRGNQLLVTDGGLLVCSNAFEGIFSSGTNLILVAGPGSVLNCIETLGIGGGGRANQLQITNGALVTVGNSLLMGANNTSSNNLVLVDNGTLRVTNLAGTGLLELRRGTNVLNGGFIEADILRMTNGGLCRLEVNGGTLSVKNSRVSVGNPVIIGNSVSPATLFLAGNGTHDMTGTLGLIVTNNATLSGNGSLLVQLQVRPGATLSPGASVGKISLSTPPFFSGTIAMELAKNGAAVTNDQIQVTGTVTYGGALTVTNLGPTTPAPGDRFQLFNASAYAGSFTSLRLPPLPVPLGWTNKLLVDGSIEVIAPPAIAISSGNYTQSFDGLSLSGGGGANLWRDNSTLLGWYAARSVAPTNITSYIASDGSGNAGALYSFGSTGSSERALGSIASDSVGTISYGLCLTNDTASSVSNFMITYTGEQWRNGSGVTNTLTFWYRVTPSALTNPEPGIVANWTQVTNLNFISPQTSASATALDGNQATNRQTFSAALVSGLVVPPGQNVFLRWHDPNDSGADQGLAVDDLTVSFSAVISTRAFGVDVSHFQNESGIPQASWDQMFAEGKRFVFIKATEGLTGPHDPTMSNNVARASAAGLLVGVYHFAHPENRPTTNGAILEASNLVVYAGSAIGQGRLRPVLDLEGSAATLSTAALTDWVIAFSDEIIARRGPGAAPIIYCSQSFANNEFDSRLADYDLWLRTVGSGSDVAFDDPPGQGFADATGVFNDWSFWQYSATGSSGGISPLDLDVCHNEYKSLTSYLIPAQPPTPINLTGIIVTGGGAFQFSFTNTPGALFTVLATTNVSLPLSNWTVLGPITETSPGQFQFSDSQTTNHPQRYYRVQSP